MEIVINFSGGKDSSAMLAYICYKYPGIKKHVVFANTGWEHPGIEEWCKNIVSKFGLELNIVKNKNKDFLSMSRNRGKFPAPAYRQCTSDLKRGPIQTWIRNNIDDTLIINCMGMRAEESPRRKKMKKLYRDKIMTNSKRTVWNYLPIHEWPVGKVFDYLKEKEIPLHPVYQYLDRLSCRICIYMKKSDILKVKKHDPEAIKIISKLEREIDFSFFPYNFIDFIN